ncbi:hypothetical protein AGMMS49965_18020 [Bacteroidia bacterium]|nr:hypothetical protein AGMMS49965_18020 [Bacteroidia bacterium]
MYKYLVRRQLRKHYKSSVRKKHFLNLKNIHTMLVLFDTRNLDEATAFIKSMKDLKKKVTVYAYQSSGDDKDYSRKGYNIITAKDTDDFFQKKLKDMVGELKKMSFDAVIDLSAQSNFSLEYLLAYAPATMKIGLKKNDLPQYDLSLSLPNVEGDAPTVRELATEIVHYLDTIQIAR